jgi:transglutaminase-like putative cysteine protease
MSAVAHACLVQVLPSAGWIELDPTNGIVGTRDLIRVAVARDPRQAIPGTAPIWPPTLAGMRPHQRRFGEVSTRYAGARMWRSGLPRGGAAEFDHA